MYVYITMGFGEYFSFFEWFYSYNNIGYFQNFWTINIQTNDLWKHLMFHSWDLELFDILL